MYQAPRKEREGKKGLYRVKVEERKKRSMKVKGKENRGGNPLGAHLTKESCRVSPIVSNGRNACPVYISPLPLIGASSFIPMPAHLFTLGNAESCLSTARWIIIGQSLSSQSSVSILSFSRPASWKLRLLHLYLGTKNVGKRMWRIFIAFLNSEFNPNGQLPFLLMSQVHPLKVLKLRM